MKRNAKTSAIKSRKSPDETLPLLRGMFIFPESLRRSSNSSRSEAPDDDYSPSDPFQHSDLEQINGKNDTTWIVSKEGLQLIIS